MAHDIQRMRYVTFTEDQFLTMQTYIEYIHHLEQASLGYKAVRKVASKDITEAQQEVYAWISLLMSEVMDHNLNEGYGKT